MKITHQGMNICEEDWSIILQHAGATMEALDIPSPSREDVVGFVTVLKADIVEA